MSNNKDLTDATYVELVDSLFQKLQNDASDVLSKGLDMTNIVVLTDRAMKEIGRIKGLVGFEKKAVVVATIKRFLKQRSDQLEAKVNAIGDKLDEEMAKAKAELERLKNVVESALDSMVDQLYSLAPELYGKVKARCQLFKCPCKKPKCCQ